MCKMSSLTFIYSKSDLSLLGFLSKVKLFFTLSNNNILTGLEEEVNII